MIKVLYISHEGASMKGATFSLINLVNSLKGKVKATVIVPSDGDACKKFDNLGIEYYIIPFAINFTEKKGLARIVTFFPRYVRDLIINHNASLQIENIIKEKQIDIVHTNSSVISVGQKLASKLKIKHVYHLREFLDKDFKFSPIIGWKLFLKQIRKSELIICITNSIQQHYKLTMLKNVCVVHDAVRKYDDVNMNIVKEKYILFCGVVSHQKGVEDAIKAFSEVIKKHPEYKLVIAGEGKADYLAYLDNLTSELNINDSVSFIGFQSNVDSLMSNASCLLMCSKFEAQGRVTVEAMFNGCPVIGFASGGTLEIIKNNETGFLYKDMESLIERICYILENNVTIVIKTAQKFAQNSFSEERYAKKIISLYNELL